MQVVATICAELHTLLDSLPTPDRAELDEALSPIGKLIPDMHFMGTLHGVIFFLSEARLLAEEEERFARSKAKSFIVNNHVMKGLENVARRRCRLPPPEARHLRRLAPGDKRRRPRKGRRIT